VAMRATIPQYDTDTSAVPGGATFEPSNTEAPADDTIPLNQDDRPAELKLFEAYGKFKSCIEDAGETIRGDLRDRNNPAYKDPKYAELIQTCAARSKILEAVQETQTARADLTPEEVETRNEAFKLLSECLKKKGWSIESAVDEKGLINPIKFQSSDGTLDERDLNQCLTETGINDAIENG
ncbi:MAG: hypothetical protein ACKOJC_03455, partial [Actinomycetota bacterium]